MIETGAIIVSVVDCQLLGLRVFIKSKRPTNFIRSSVRHSVCGQGIWLGEWFPAFTGHQTWFRSRANELVAIV